MKIAVLGTGMVGRALSGRLLELGHEVTMGTRDPVATAARDDGCGAFLAANPGIVLAEFADAAAAGAVIVYAGSGGVAVDVLSEVGAHHLSGKVLIDISNPLDFSQGFPPTLLIKDTDSLGEQIQTAFPEAYVVKTLNTMTADLMVRPHLLGAESSVFVSGDSADAKGLVSGLLREFGHTDIIDLGDITTARGTEMYLPLWLRLYGALGTGMLNVKVVR